MANQKVEVDLIVEAIVKGFGQLSKEQLGAAAAAKKVADAEKALADATKKANKETEEQRKKAEESKLSLTDLKSGIDLVVSGLRTVVGFGKDVFEFAEGGAQFEQLRQSAASLGVDLQALRDAAGGTVSDFELLSSTQTLLIGTQGQLKESFIDNAGNLLKIAKAANKLNPALGDTTFLYESLARGVKRSSPLILDNLGLVIKIGAVNEKYAKALGKTTKELSATEKQQALLNAVLEEGKNLIRDAGDGVEGAADQYAITRASIDNLVDSYKLLVASVFDSEGAIAGEIDARAALNTALADGLINFATWLDIVPLLSEAHDNQEKVMRILNATIMNNLGLTEDLISETENADRILSQYSKSILGTGEAFDEASDEAEEAKSVFDTVYSGIDLDLPSKIESSWKKINLMRAGGQTVEDYFNFILDNIEDIPAEEVEQVFIDVATAALAVQVAAGDITTVEAAQELHEEFGVPFIQAKEDVVDLEGAMQSIKNVEMHHKLTNELLPFEKADIMAMGINQKLTTLVSKDWNIRINIIVDGVIPSPPSTDPPKPRHPDHLSLAGGAGGAFMKVPSGFSNDSFNMGLTSGELVMVLNQKQQSALGAGKAAAGATAGGGGGLTEADVLGMMSAQADEFSDAIETAVGRLIKEG